jgi:hypothetical protein
MSDDDTHTHPGVRRRACFLVLFVLALAAPWDWAVAESAAEPGRAAAVPALPPCAGPAPAAAKPPWPASTQPKLPG